MNHVCPTCSQVVAQSSRVMFDHGANRVVIDGGEPIRLTRVEADIFAVLWERHPSFVTSENILMRVGGLGGPDGDELRNLYVHLSNMRKKFKRFGAKVMIAGIRDRGYRLELL